MFNSENNNNLQFDITLNNEIIVLECFIQIFGMACFLKENLTIPKIN